MFAGFVSPCDSSPTSSCLACSMYPFLWCFVPGHARLVDKRGGLVGNAAMSR